MHVNDFGGVAEYVVQARDIHGLHLTRYVNSGVAPDPLYRALYEATVQIRTRHGEGQGVFIAPGVVLTSAALLAPGAAPGVRLLSLVDGGERYACVTGGVPSPTMRAAADGAAGAPVLDWRTGAVCGVSDGVGGVLPVPPDDAWRILGRRNITWLDLLDDGQLRAGRWRHPRPALRAYLTALRSIDQVHDHRAVQQVAPALSTLYLERKAESQHRGDDESPEVVDAETLLATVPNVQVLGEPGSGKSSLVYRIAAQTAAAWLGHFDGDYVPVVVSASAFAKPGTLPDVLIRGMPSGIKHTLGLGSLAELLESPPMPDVQWLVLVDGFDEVLGDHSRQAVVRWIAELRRRGTHRVLVTSRVVGEAALRPLVHDVDSPTYVLVPFSDTDLVEFCVRFLRGNRVADPEVAARDLVDRIARTKLYPLAHTPLIATMLCVLHVEGVSLPDNQIQLYRQFVDWHLRKLRDRNVLAVLRERLAPYGSATEASANQLISDLEPLLEHIAHQRLEDEHDSTPLDLAVASPQVQRPDRLPLSSWRNIVSEVLRLSGVLVQHGEALAYRHSTIEEFLAAAHIARRHRRPDSRTARKFLAPQPTWPWHGLQVRVFLAEHWLDDTDDNIDLTRLLRRLLRRWNRRHNIGFIAELVRHGTEVPAQVVAEAVDRVEELLTRKLPLHEWEDKAKWLIDLDRGRAVVVLSGMVANPVFDEYRKFPAARALLRHAPREGMPALRLFLSDADISEHGRTTLVRLAQESDRALAIDLLRETAEQAENPAVLQFAINLIVSLDRDLAIRLYHRNATDPGVSTAWRFSAAISLAPLDRELGADALEGVVTSARDSAIRTQALNALFRTRRHTVRPLLTRLLASREADHETRFDAACFLIDRFDEAPALLVDLVDEDACPQALVLKAARRMPDDPAMLDRLDRLLRRCRKRRERVVDAILAVADVAQDLACQHLTEVVNGIGVPVDVQVDGLKRGRMILPPPTVLSAVSALAANSTIVADRRLAVVELAIQVDRRAGEELAGRLADDSDLPLPERVRAADLILNRRTRFAAFEAIANDSKISERARLDAPAKATPSARPDLRRALTRASLTVDSRFRLLRQLDTADAVDLATVLARSGTVPGSRRIDAAMVVLKRNRHQGRRLLAELAENPRLSDADRKRAQAALERLRS